MAWEVAHFPIIHENALHPLIKYETFSDTQNADRLTMLRGVDRDVEEDDEEPHKKFNQSTTDVSFGDQK